MRILLRSAARIANFTVATMIAIFLAYPCTLAVHAKSPDHKIAGYYVSWSAYGRNYTPRDIDATKFTHIIYAFANIDNGVITPGDAAVDPGNFAELRELKRKHDHLKLLIAVGGWEGSKHFSDIAATDQDRKRFANSVVAFLRDNGFDGMP